MKYIKENKITIAIVVIILIVLAAIIVYASRSYHSASSFSDVTVEDINNAKYKVWGEDVTFVDGKYATTDPQNLISSTIDFSAIGDVNRDGKRDALAVTTTSRADSIDELHLLIKFGNIIATKPLDIPVGKGNSVRSIKSLSIDSNGIINLTMDILEPNDPHCCASIHATHQYRFLHDKLVLIK